MHTVVAVVLAILFIVESCSGGSQHVQASNREPQVYSAPTDDPNVVEITNLPDGVSVPIHVGTQPIRNLNEYAIGVQCDGVPSIANRVGSGEKYSDLVGLCDKVIVWKTSE